MVYFSMAEWDFLEEQRDLYKDVMMDNQQLLSYVNLGKNNLLLSEMILNLTLSQPPLTSPDGSRKRNPPERCPRPLYSRDPTQEDHNYAHRFQGKDLIDLKVEVNVEQTYVGGDQSREQVEMMAPLKEEESFHVRMEDRPLITTPDGSRKRNPPERCPPPLDSRDSTQEDLTVPHHDQVDGSEGHKDLYKDIMMEPADNRNPPERCPRPLYSEDSTQEDHNYAQPYQCEDRGNMKADNKTGEEEEIIDVRGDHPSTEDSGMTVTEIEEESSPDITKDGSSNGESPERCPRPLDFRDSTLEDHNYAQHYQCEDLMSMRANNKAEEEEEINVRGDHQSTEETGVLMTENKEESSPDITKDGSSSSNTPKKCPRPLCSPDSTQEDLTVPQPDQDEELKIKVKKEEEEMYVAGEQRASEEVEMMDTDKEEESSPDIRSDGHSVRNSSEGDPILPPDYKAEDDDITQHSPGVNPIPHNRHSRLETSRDPSSPEEPSDQSQTRTSYDPLISHRVDRSKDPSNLMESSKDCKGPLPGGHLWSCLECGKRFTKNRTLIKHQRIHPGERPFSCTECGKCFTVKGELLRHQRLHTGEEHFSCSDFRRCFNQKGKLNISQKIFTDDHSLSCLECGKCFLQKGDLLEHHRIHTGKHPFTCSECEKCFIEKRTLLIHHTSHTGEHPHSCLDCGKSFTRNNTLIRHRRGHTGEHSFSCSECGKCFVQKEHLQRHQKIHTYGKGFSVKGSLLIHKTIHTGERPFPCSECGKCFAAKGKLLIHQRIHRGERPYSCSECGKCFSAKGGLLIHQRVHMGERPFLCPACGKCFAEKGSLLKHQRHHTRKSPFPCSECGKGFKHKENLIRHQSTHSC